MYLGAELPNIDRALTPEECDKLRALRAEFVRLRYVREDVVRQCLEAGVGEFIIRPRKDGRIVEAWVDELKAGADLVTRLGGRPILNLVNEPNHPERSPYAHMDEDVFAQDYLALRGRLSGWETVSPNLTLHAADLEWAREHRDLWETDTYIGLSLYWQYDNELSEDWGLRVKRFRPYWPTRQFIVVEAGDSTPERGPEEKTGHIIRNMLALQALGYVSHYCLFLPLGGTADWGPDARPSGNDFTLSVAECERIRAALDGATIQDSLIVGGEEKPMKPIYVACCYSLQDRNTYVPASGIALNNEYAATRWLMEAKVVPMLEAAGVHAQAFGDYPESQDEPPGSLSGLRLQMAQARAWLDSCPADALRVVLSIHTDSGDFGHTFGIYGCDGSERSARAQELGAVLAAHVGPVFAHTDIRNFCRLGTTDYTGYVFWQQTYPYPSVLVELCSHRYAPDLDVLYNAPDAVAQALVDGVLAYAGETAPAPLPEPQPSPDHVTARQALDTMWGIGERLLAYPVPQLQDAGQSIHDYIVLAKADLKAQGVPNMD